MENPIKLDDLGGPPLFFKNSRELPGVAVGGTGSMVDQDYVDSEDAQEIPSVSETGQGRKACDIGGAKEPGMMYFPTK